MDPGPAPDLLSDVVARHGPRLLLLPGVVGFGEGLRENRPCLILFVTSPEAALSDLPATLDGYPVIVERIERFQAQGLK